MRRLTLTMGILLLLGFPVRAAGWYAVLGAGADGRAAASFVDWDSSLAKPTPMFGAGYAASGHFRKSLWVETGVGRQLTPGISWEATGIWHPSSGFSGSVNFPNSGANQPAQATIRSLAGMMSVVLEPLPLLGFRAGSVSPTLGIGGGVAFNRVERLIMSFPDLRRPHTFTTPGGSSACAALTLSAGLRFRCSSKLSLGLQYRFTELGHADTEPGDGILYRPAENQTVVIPINGTTVRLRRHDLELLVNWRI
jgi:hypothetical protein